MDRTRILAAGIAALIVVAAAGYSALWLIGAGDAERGTHAWLASQRAEGWTAQADDIAVGGYPGFITVRIDGLRLAPPPDRAAVPWQWEAEQVAIRAEPWALRRPFIAPVGRQTVVLPVGPGGTSAAVDLTAAQAETRLHIDSAGKVIGLQAEVVDLAARLPGGAPLFSLDLLDTALVPQAERHELMGLQEPSYAAHLVMRGLTLADTDGAALPLGARAEVLEVRGQVLGPFLPRPDRTFHDTVQAWRDAGGTIDVEQLRLMWSPLSVAAAGTVALDGNLQPEAALTARLQGFFQAITQLEQNGVVRPRDASVARVVLGVMAQRDPQGGAPVLSVPLSIQNRLMRVGPVAVGTLPPIRWGGSSVPDVEPIAPGFIIDRYGQVVREP